MVFAFAGDSTITKFFCILYSCSFTFGLQKQAKVLVTPYLYRRFFVFLTFKPKNNGIQGQKKNRCQQMIAILEFGRQPHWETVPIHFLMSRTSIEKKIQRKIKNRVTYDINRQYLTIFQLVIHSFLVLLDFCSDCQHSIFCFWGKPRVNQR